MSAGQTAERVHDAIRQRIREGEFRPGDRLDPAALAFELNSSVTPVRDALHQLTGERLIESRTGEGFHLPAADAPGLQDLYGWCAQVILLALRGAGRLMATKIEPGTDRDIVAATERLFARLVAASGNAEHEHTMRSIADRLHAVRLIEGGVIEDRREELATLERAFAENDLPAVRTLVMRYHRRRRLAAASLVRMLYRR